MTKEIVKISQFKSIGDDLMVSMTAEVTDIQAVLEEQYPVSAIPTDLSVKENYELVKSAIKAIKTPRIALEKDRKAISSVPFNLCKKINSAAKPIREALTELEDAWKSKKSEYDEKIEREKLKQVQLEEERIRKIDEKIEKIKMAPIVNMDKKSSELQEILDDTIVELQDMSWAMEREEDAQDIITATTERLETLIAAKKAQEEAEVKQKEAAAKIEADKKAAEEKARADREEQDRKNKEEADRLAAANVKLEAEKKKFQEEQEAKRKEDDAKEQARLAAIKKQDDEREAKFKAEKAAAQKIENDRLAAIKKEEDEKAAKLKAEQEQKEAEAKAKAEKEEAERKQHALAENLIERKREAAEALTPIVTDCDHAFDIVNAIVEGKIPHVTFA